MFGGLLAARLADALHGFIAPNRVALMMLELLRVDVQRVAEGFHHGRESRADPGMAVGSYICLETVNRPTSSACICRTHDYVLMENCSCVAAPFFSAPARF